jgi:hypothetical protein
MPWLLTEPRFWGEEARDYFEPIRHKDLLGALVHVGQDSYQFALNLTTFLASRAPLELAPAVTTYSSLLVVSVFGALLGVFASDRRLHPLVFGLLLGAVALVPSGYEVYLSMTNSQWVLAATMVALLCLTPDKRPRAVTALTIWALFCGLSGVPAVILAPVFLLAAWLYRSLLHFAVGIALSAAALVQLGTILMGGTSRSLAGDILSLSMPILLQAVLAPTVGVIPTRVMVNFAQSQPATFMAMALAAVLFVVSLSWIAARRFGPVLPTLLVAGMALLGVLLTLGSLDTPSGLFVPVWGGRYFFATTVGLLLLIALATKGAARAAGPLLLWIVILGAVQQSAILVPFDRGPSWKDELSACENTLPCDAAVWPVFFGVVTMRPVTFDDSILVD